MNLIEVKRCLIYIYTHTAEKGFQILEIVLKISNDYITAVSSCKNFLRLRMLSKCILVYMVNRVYLNQTVLPRGFRFEDCDTCEADCESIIKKWRSYQLALRLPLGSGLYFFRIHGEIYYFVSLLYPDEENKT